MTKLIGLWWMPDPTLVASIDCRGDVIKDGRFIGDFVDRFSSHKLVSLFEKKA